MKEWIKQTTVKRLARYSQILELEGGWEKKKKKGERGKEMGDPLPEIAATAMPLLSQLPL